MAQATKQIVAYMVRQGDSLERIARKYMGSAEQWLQLAILNGLDYPYLTDDTTLVRNVPATGTVTFARVSGSTGAVVIPAGSSVYAPATANAPRRYYTTDSSATIPDGTDTITAAVTAVLTGEIGNAPSRAVIALGVTVTNLASVTNAAPLTGGATLSVKFPGDTLLVYVDATGASDTEGVNTEALKGTQFYASILGVDVGLSKDGDLQADSKGSLALVSGLDNLREALRHRLEIPLGWYPFYPTYGTGVERAIGERAETVWLQWVAVEVERTVRTEPRVADVKNVKVEYAGGIMQLSLDIIAIGENNPQNLVFQIRPSGGA